MAFEERMLAHVADDGRRRARRGDREHFGTEVTVPTLPFPRITMAEAHARSSGRRGRCGRDDLDPAGERAVAARVGRDRA